MKPIFCFFTILGVFSTTPSSIADPDSPPLPPPPGVPAPPAEPAEFRLPVPPRPPQDFLLAQEAVAEAEAVLEELVEPHMDHVGRALSALNLSRRSNMAGRTVVVPGETVQAEQLREMDEDLNVMARVLEKSVAATRNEANSRRAMGIELQSLVSSSGGPRNLYLDGYGALFFLRVNFPLLAPPTKEDDESHATNEPTSSAWEEARADLYGDRRSEPFARGARRGEEYDENKVENLKESLIEALKHAAHIRHLKAEEAITLVVAGASAGGQGGKRVMVGLDGGDGRKRDVFKYVEGGRISAERGGSTLLVRVRKSDADAFANDKLTNEEFRKKATMLVY